MTLNKEQQRVYEWLNVDLSLHVFAEAYKGAVILIRQKPAGYISFVAHAGRDLMNLLAPAVAGVTPGRVQYHQHLDQLGDDWRNEWSLSDDLSPGIIEKGHFIPIKVCQRISTLIDEHKAGRQRGVGKVELYFSTFLEYSDKDRIPSNFLAEWKAAREWFLAHAHLRDAPFREEIDGDLAKHFNCLDGYLYIAASSQYERLKTLNEILDTTNR